MLPILLAATATKRVDIHPPLILTIFRVFVTIVATLYVLPAPPVPAKPERNDRNVEATLLSVMPSFKPKRNAA